MADTEDRERPAELGELRAAIEALAADDGPFVVRCGRRGDRPVPVDDCRFPDRASAARAARLVCEYRHRLRRWDSRTAYCAPIVHEESPAAVDHRSCEDAPIFEGSLVDRVRADGGTTAEEE